MLRLRAGTTTLIIGARASAGSKAHPHNIESEDDIRRRLNQAFSDPWSRDAIRRFWGHWQGDARLSGIKDASIADRVARLCVRGPLVAFVVVDTTVHLRGTSAIHATSTAMLRNVMAQAPLPHQRGLMQRPSVVPNTTSRMAFIRLTLVERLAITLFLTADSRRLPAHIQYEMKRQLAEPAFVAWFTGGLTVWFVGRGALVDEVLDALLAAAPLSLGGGRLVLDFRTLVDAAHAVQSFVADTQSAVSGDDLDEAADVLAEVIALIGWPVLIATVRYAITRPTSHGLQGKSGARPPPPRAAPPARTAPSATPAATKEFANENAQAKTLKAAAANGTPFVEVCSL